MSFDQLVQSCRVMWTLRHLYFSPNLQLSPSPLLSPNPDHIKPNVSSCVEYVVVWDTTNVQRLCYVCLLLHILHYCIFASRKFHQFHQFHQRRPLVKTLSSNFFLSHVVQPCWMLGSTLITIPSLFSFLLMSLVVQGTTMGPTKLLSSKQPQSRWLSNNLQQQHITKQAGHNNIVWTLTESIQVRTESV